MKKGIYTWFDNDLSPDESYCIIKKAGFDSVMVDWMGDFPRSIAKDKNVFFIDKYGLEIENAHLSFKDINRMWTDTIDGENRFETLQNDIILAGKFNVPILVIHTADGLNPPPVSDIGLFRFGKLIETAQRSNVKLAFENCRNNSYLDTIFEKFQSEYVGFCYDSGHRNCRTPNDNYLNKYKNKVIAIHLHDNDGTDDQHHLPFTGTIDWDKEMTALKQTTYKGSLTLEVGNKSNIPYEEFVQKASQVADRLINLLQHK